MGKIGKERGFGKWVGIEKEIRPSEKMSSQGKDPDIGIFQVQ